MSQLIRIGNSKGIRIPKTLIDQADLENKQLELKIVKEGLLIKTHPKPRQGWQEAVSKALEQNQILTDDDWLEADLDTDFKKL